MYEIALIVISTRSRIVPAMRRFGRPDREVRDYMCVMAFVILVIKADVRIQRGKKKAPAPVKRKIEESPARAHKTGS